MSKGIENNNAARASTDSHTEDARLKLSGLREEECAERQTDAGEEDEHRNANQWAVFTVEPDGE